MQKFHNHEKNCGTLSQFFVILRPKETNTTQKAALQKQQNYRSYTHFPQRDASMAPVLINSNRGTTLHQFKVQF